MKGLTKRQQDVLKFIKSYIASHKFPPTIREVAEHFDISVKGSYDHIKALEKKKYIKCNVNRSRAIEVILDEDKSDGTVVQVPVLGNVAAGKPLFADENFEGVVKVPEQYIGNGKHFALNVKGESMQDAGIMDGDIAIINHQNYADNGDIIVAVIDEAVTLKRFFKEKNRIMLKAENKAFPPIYSQNIRILGKLSYLIRKYE
ncbi:MAG: transcriptional repressor LexA [Spirochaetia bacterium]